MVAGQIDVVPPGRRHLIASHCTVRRTATAQLVDGASEIATLEQNDGSGDQIERSGSGLLVFGATIPEAAEAMERDGTSVYCAPRPC
jgi:hypothetical protein